jgi:FkbM family methyltransferase
MANPVAILLSLLGLSCLVVVPSFWPQALLTGGLEGRVGKARVSSQIPGACSSATLAAREADHHSAVAFRHELVRRWAPEGSVEAWDAQLPLDAAKAWESPTVWDVFAPTYGCFRPVHVGGVGSQHWSTTLPLESKVVCNPQLLQSADPCVIYSFGVGWDTTFEIAMLRMAPHCKVRVFDPTTTSEKFWAMVRAQTPEGQAAPQSPALTFEQVGLASKSMEDYREGMLWNGKESIRVRTLQDLMAQHGDEQLTILKVDVEGSEWTALHQAGEVGTLAHVDQLLLEVHMRGCEAGYSEHGRSKMSDLMSTLEASGLRAFSNVPNLGPTGKGALPACGEYSFVNVRSSFVTQSCGA